MSDTVDRAAQEAVQAFYDAWNSRDIEAVRATQHFPHVTFAPDEVIVRQGEAEYESPFERLDAEGWDHSTIEAWRVVWSTDDRAFVEIQYSRYRADGTRYREGTMIYGVTEQNGHWGIQFRTRGLLHIFDR